MRPGHPLGAVRHLTLGQAQALNMLDEELLKREATFGPMKFPGWIEESGSFVYLVRGRWWPCRRAVLIGPQEYLETHEEIRKDCGGMTISMRRQSWVLSVPFFEESEDAATTKAASMIPKLLPYVPDNTTVTVGSMKEFGFSKTFAAVFCLEGTNLPTHARAGCPVHLFKCGETRHRAVTGEFNLLRFCSAQEAPLDGSSVALIRLNPADDRHNEFATQVFDKAESAQGIKGDVAAVRPLGVRYLCATDSPRRFQCPSYPNGSGITLGWRLPLFGKTCACAALNTPC